MALSEHELIYHYRMDGGLQDSGPKGFHASTTSEEGTAYNYVENKDGVADRAIEGTATGMTMSMPNESIRAEWDLSDPILVSMWVKRTGEWPQSYTASPQVSISLGWCTRYTSHTQYIFSLGSGYVSNSITLLRNGLSPVSIPDTGIWYHVCFYGDGSQVISFRNGVRVDHASFSTFDVSSNPSFQSRIKDAEIDEVRFYKLAGPIDHGTTGNNQPGGAEIAEVYNLGVNNIPAPNITSITEVTHNSAKVNWEVNSV